VLPAWATVTIAVGASAITALSAFFGSLAARGDKGAWRNTQLATAHAFATAVDRALREVSAAALDVRSDQSARQASLSRAKRHLEAVADAHTHVLLVYGAGNRGELATHAYQTVRAAADALSARERGEDEAATHVGVEIQSLRSIESKLVESRASLQEFIAQTSRSVRGRRPLRLVRTLCFTRTPTMQGSGAGHRCG